MDENDLLFTNSFYPIHSDTASITSFKFKEQFKQRYSDETQEDNDEYDDDSFSKFTPSIKTVGTGIKNVSVIPRTTIINIDSRDRDKLLYPKPNHFKMFLGKTFYNVKSVKLLSIEFPNTNAVINKSNNVIQWINQEDIDQELLDTVTGYYPIYSSELRVGSYISSTLSTEIQNKLGIVKRRNKLGDYHTFLVNMDLDTDIVTFTSLIVSKLPNNAFTVTSNLNLISVNAPNNG